MSLATFEAFDGADIAAFVASMAVGFFASTFAPAGPASIYTSVLVSYHVFLGWLIFFAKGHRQAGVSLPVAQTLVTHAACVLLIMSPIVTAVAKHVIPTPDAVQDSATGPEADPNAAMAAQMEMMNRQRGLFRLVQVLCGSVAGLAVFERRWLFSSEKEGAPKPVAPVVTPTAIEATAIKATAEDAQEWSRYLAQRKPGSYKAGSSLKAEYEQWLLERYKSRAVQGAEDAGARAG
jgi:hypothetical protein